MADDLDDLKTRMDDAIVERCRVRDLRDKRRYELEKEARARIEAQLEAEFGPELKAVKETEITQTRAYQDAQIAAGKRRLAQSNYGVLVEWDTRQNNWFNTERRQLLYRTGNRGRLEVTEHNTVFPDNREYGLPRPGELFIRLIKKNGEPGRKIRTLGHDQNVPSNWYPEGELPEKAAKSEREEA